MIFLKTVVIASNNKNKIREFKSILNIDNIEFKSMSDIGFTDDIIEDGNSFEENALINAFSKKLLPSSIISSWNPISSILLNSILFIFNIDLNSLILFLLLLAITTVFKKIT